MTISSTMVVGLKARYAILVRSDVKRQGLGRRLMEKMVRYCRSRGTRQIVGQVLYNNKGMLDLVRGLGFESKKMLDEDIVEVVLARFGEPEIFNTDQGAQFTSAAFTTRLEVAGIGISMDGRGRWAR